jgi:peptidyl-tRNA hydrolase, PTH1 family
MYTIVGLGNPGDEYKETRHNAGRIAVEVFAKKYQFPDFIKSAKYNAFISQSEIESSTAKSGVEKVTLALPETYMNKSGASVSLLIGSIVGDTIKNEKKAQKLIVVHDDLDMPIGKVKIVFNRGSGGHKGVESIKRSIKTESFIRIKIGICPTTPTGKLKKPVGEKLMDFIVGEFKPEELSEIKKISKKVAEILNTIVDQGLAMAMNQYNQG